jgi:hypothetical protein
MLLEVAGTLGSSGAGPLFTALARHPRVSKPLWESLRAGAASEEFRQRAGQLGRESRDLLTQACFLPDHIANLVRLSLADETEAIMESVAEQERAAPRQALLTQVALRALLGGLPSGHDPRSIPPATAELTLEESEDWAESPDTPPLVVEAEKALGAPVPVALLRALAPWPGYLEYSWRKLLPLLRTPRVQEAGRQVGEVSANLSLRFPGVALDPGLPRTAGATSEELAECRDLAARIAAFQPLEVLLCSAYALSLGLPPT